MRGGPRARRHHSGRWHVHARVERFAEPALLLLLRALEEEGLVASEWADGKRTYAITDAGGRLLDEWVDALRRARARTDEFIRRFEERR